MKIENKIKIICTVLIVLCLVCGSYLENNSNNEIISEPVEYVEKIYLYINIDSIINNETNPKIYTKEDINLMLLRGDFKKWYILVI